MPSTVIILSEVFSRPFFGQDEFSRPGSGRLKKRRPKKRIIISLEKSDRISSVVLIRMEKMIWQQIFQFPTAPPPPTAVHLPLHMGGRHVRCFSFIICLISSRIQVLFSFLFCAFSYLVEPYRFVLSLAHGGSGRDKKDAEASKTASSPYKCTAETVFGGRKSG